MFKPVHIVLAARAVLLVGSLAVVILTLGPFQGLEHVIGLSDKTAHAIAFGALTAISFLAFPSRRRSDLVWAALVMGAGVEFVQMFDPHRSASLLDWLADAGGVLAVYGSSMIETVRKMAREQGQMSFAQIAATDRRRRRRKHAVVFTPGAAEGASFAERASKRFPSPTKA